jgi:hypothetical protein
LAEVATIVKFLGLRMTEEEVLGAFCRVFPFLILFLELATVVKFLGLRMTEEEVLGALCRVFPFRILFLKLATVVKFLNLRMPEEEVHMLCALGRVCSLLMFNYVSNFSGQSWQQW